MKSDLRILLKLAALVLAGVASFLGFFVLLAGVASVLQWGSGRFWNFPSEPEAFLVPEGYHGGLTIVFGDTSAPRAPRLGMARLYDFRGGPVLRVRDPVPSGHRSPDWYFVDARGGRRHFLRGERCSDGAVVQPLVCRPIGRAGFVPAGGPVYEYETWAVVREQRAVVPLVNAGPDLVGAAFDDARRPR